MIFSRPELAQYSAERKELTSVKLMTFMTSVSRSVLLLSHYILYVWLVTWYIQVWVHPSRMLGPWDFLDNMEHHV